MTGPVGIGRVALDINTMLYAALLIIVGVQVIYFAIFSKIYAVSTELIPSNKLIDTFLRLFTLERGLLAGGVLSAAGIAGLVYAIVVWGEKTFGQLVPGEIMRITIPSLTLTLVGVQTIFACFLVTTMTLQKKK
jgi:hypothetical protein